MALFLYTIIYAVFGWMIEVIYYLFKTKHFVNRGFLHGPFVPIYGISLLFLHLSLFYLFNDFSSVTPIMLLSVFILIVLIGTLLELVGGIVLFNLFNTRWWDYSDQPLNYQGYVCLPFSLLWGVLGTGSFFLIHLQFVIPFIESIPKQAMTTVTYVLIGILTIDYTFTLRSLFNFKSMVIEFKDHLNYLQTQSKNLRSKLPRPLHESIETIRQSDSFINTMKQVHKAKLVAQSLKQKLMLKDVNSLDQITDKIHHTRLYKAFPNLKLLDGKKKRDKNA